MGETHPDTRIDRTGPRRRPRLHLVYFALAAFDLVTVCLSLFLIDRVTGIYTGSVEVNQVWAARLADFSELSRLASAMNAPGNDVFISRNPEHEAAKLAEAGRKLDAVLDTVREDLVAHADDPRVASLLEVFEGIDEPVATMRAEAAAIFELIGRDEADEAGRRMANMDRAFVQVNDKLVDLGDQVREIQRRHFAEQTDAARMLRRFEFAIAGAIVLMVAGVTFYGHRLARQLRETSHQTQRTLAALEDREERLRAIVETASDAIITVGPDGRIESANRAAARIFAAEPEVLAGLPVDALLPSLPRPGARGEREAHRHGGATFPAEVAVTEARLSDRRFATVIVRDITGRKQADAELARYREHLETLVDERTAALEQSHEQLRMADRLASIGTLAAGLGHDMGNALFPVRCRLDTLEEATDDERLRRELAGVRRSVEFLLQLSDGLRLLALDPDDPGASAGATDLCTWWPEVEPLLATALPSSATLEVDLADGLPPIGVPAHRLTQAIFNLVVNAGEALGEHGHVRVSAAPHGDRRFVRITVRDDGHGMSDETRRRCLDPFFTTKTRGLSTGLGLALVHGVAKSVGGTVEIDSAPERGTTVTLRLPAAEAPVAVAPVEGGAPLARVGLGDGRLAAVVTALLESAGYRVERTDGAGPDGAALWVIELAGADRGAVSRYLEGAPGRSIIAFGEGGDDGPPPGMVVVDPASGFAGMQRAIATVVRTEQES